MVASATTRCNPSKVPYVESAVVGDSMQDTHVGVNGYGRLPPSAAVVRDSWRRGQKIFGTGRELQSEEGVSYVSDEIAGVAEEYLTQYEA